MEFARKGEFYVMTSQKQGSYTIADIDALPEGQRAELIDGRMYMMASPALSHQDILIWLSVEIFNYIKSHKGKCRVVPAPFGVFIRKDDRNYFEPDISVICDRDRLDERGCHGAPDWVVEIVSPSSRRMDYRLKLPVYKETGVREYWIVDYARRQVSVYLLQESDTPRVYSFTDTIPVAIYGDFAIDFSQLLDYLI
ncbi:hypothetical protein AMURIS_05200 [Acetatifactor muris]|uniref:Putative restriction endonuclease domain-containing protein n=2 Tax=Acetatifactor muris TaxID=879566 RepID=A0A2K4ZPN6_9FIRM|nr:Uma2 family endonuclease [Acetatifactor muris]SOY32441.1 hypothetical protein AMURIS_05200 [Acetatifactor muris]